MWSQIRAQVIRRSMPFAMMLGFSLFASPLSHAQQERLDIDPIVQGIWYVHATSEDEGRTIDTIDPPAMMCRVRATEVLMLDGQTLPVQSVHIIDDSAGNPMNVVTFTNGVVWGISKTPGQTFVLVQVFKGLTELDETIRFLVTVQK